MAIIMILLQSAVLWSLSSAQGTRMRVSFGFVCDLVVLDTGRLTDRD